MYTLLPGLGWGRLRLADAARGVGSAEPNSDIVAQINDRVQNRIRLTDLRFFLKKMGI